MSSIPEPVRRRLALVLMLAIGLVVRDRQTPPLYARAGAQVVEMTAG